MKDFDIELNFNGVKNDLLYINANGINETEKKPVAEQKTTSKETSEKETKKIDSKPNWASQLDKYTNLFKEISSYETPAEREARIEKEKNEKGKKTTIFGLNPLIVISLSVVLIVGGVVAVVKLKGK